MLLVCGFFKHFLGSGFGLWSWYCNNGEACKTTLSQDQIYEANTNYLLRDSIYEALLYLIVGTLLNYIITNKYILFFIIGLLLHIISEIIGIHKSFCKKTCEIIT
jgi:hypothetical protein